MVIGQRPRSLLCHMGSVCERNMWRKLWDFFFPLFTDELNDEIRFIAWPLSVNGLLCSPGGSVLLPGCKFLLFGKLESHCEWMNKDWDRRQLCQAGNQMLAFIFAQSSDNSAKSTFLVLSCFSEVTHNSAVLSLMSGKSRTDLVYLPCSQTVYLFVLQTVEQAYRQIQNIVDFSSNVMSSLLGEKFVHSGVSARPVCCPSDIWSLGLN